MNTLKRIFLILVLVGLTTSLTASPLSILASLTQTGNTVGGLRYTLDESWAVDGWATRSRDGSQNLQTAYWGDIYYKNWGLIVSDSGDRTLNLAFAYAMELELQDGILLGVSVKLIELNDQSPQFAFGWDPYVVLNMSF
jgi:hypothetical protein